MIKSIFTHPFIVFIGLFITQSLHSQTGVGINTTGAAADASAMLDVSSTTGGMLVPRMTTAQRNAISSPTTSLLIFNTDSGSFEFYNGSSWSVINNGLYTGSGTVPSATAVTITDNLNFDANTLYINGTNNRVGINNNAPSSSLDIVGDSKTSGDIYFGTSGAVLKGTDQGGTLELGPSIGSGEVPFIDFHYGTGSAQDFNVRLINVADNRLDFNTNIGTPLTLNGASVGIGRTSPEAKLHIYDNATSSQIFLGENGASDKTGIIKYLQGNGSGTGYFALGHWGDNIDGGTGLIIKKGGNIGVGTNNPSHPLDISGNARANGEVISTLNGVAQLRAIGGDYGFFVRNDGTNTYFMLTNSGDQYGAWNGLRPLVIDDATGNVDLGNNALNVQHGGNTGVGTTTPYDKLDVNGDIRLGKYADNGSRYIGYANGNTNVASTPIAGLEIESVAPGTYSQNLHFYTHHFGVAAAKRMTVQYDGNVGIGTTTPTSMLHLANGGELRVYDPSNTAYVSLKHSGASGGNVHLDAMNGGATYINWFGGSSVDIGNGAQGYGVINASAFNIASSERFKEDIVDSEYGLAQVMELEAKEYKYISDESNRNEVGLIAEEVEKILPEVVYKDKNGLISGIDYSKLSPVLIEAIKEQQALIELLTKRIEELEKK